MEKNAFSSTRPLPYRSVNPLRIGLGSQATTFHASQSLFIADQVDTDFTTEIGGLPKTHEEFHKNLEIACRSIGKKFKSQCESLGAHVDNLTKLISEPWQTRLSAVKSVLKSLLVLADHSMQEAIKGLQEADQKELAAIFGDEEQNLQKLTYRNVWWRVIVNNNSLIGESYQNFWMTMLGLDEGYFKHLKLSDGIKNYFKLLKLRHVKNTDPDEDTLLRYLLDECQKRVFGLVGHTIAEGEENLLFKQLGFYLCILKNVTNFKVYSLKGALHEKLHLFEITPLNSAKTLQNFVVNDQLNFREMQKLTGVMDDLIQNLDDLTIFQPLKRSVEILALKYQKMLTIELKYKYTYKWKQISEDRLYRISPCGKFQMYRCTGDVYTRPDMVLVDMKDVPH